MGHVEIIPQEFFASFLALVVGGLFIGVLGRSIIYTPSKEPSRRPPKPLPTIMSLPGGPAVIISDKPKICDPDDAPKKIVHHIFMNKIEQEEKKEQEKSPELEKFYPDPTSKKPDGLDREWRDKNMPPGTPKVERTPDFDLEAHEKADSAELLAYLAELDNRWGMEGYDLDQFRDMYERSERMKTLRGQEQMIEEGEKARKAKEVKENEELEPENEYAEYDKWEEIQNLERIIAVGEEAQQMKQQRLEKELAQEEAPAHRLIQEWKQGKNTKKRCKEVEKWCKTQNDKEFWRNEYLREEQLLQKAQRTNKITQSSDKTPETTSINPEASLVGTVFVILPILIIVISWFF